MLNIEEYLSNYYKGNRKPSLKAMKYFINIYDNFEKNMNFIHIAGTNGKGSCVETISNILINQGYKVGKFISPHLVSYNERISINNKYISNIEMENLIYELDETIKKYNEKGNTQVTFFELETIIALLYFYRNNVDFAILETGLGGLYDCTNIITKPIVSVITSIGFDHMHILGNTLPEIAYQKAGIIKDNSETVIFDQKNEINNIFIETCKSKNNILHIVKNSDITNYHFDDEYQYFNYKNIKNLSINLKGKNQVKNASLCIEVMDILNKKGVYVDINNIRKGLKTVIHKARMEKINKNPLIIYDGAHNEPAINNLLDMVNMYYPNRKRTYILSILKRKDYKKMLELLSKDKNAKFVFTSGNDEKKYTSKEELYNYMKNFTNENKIYKKDLKTSIDDVLNTNTDEVTLIIGSFYIYNTVIEEIHNLKSV